MARKSHYQSVGNPMQMERLPLRRSEMAIPYQPYDHDEDSLFARRQLFWLGWIAVATAVVRIVLLAKRPSPAASFLASAGLLVGTALLASPSVKKLDRRDSILTAISMLATLLLLNLPLAIGAQAFSVCLIMGAMTYLVASHWTRLCTTTPLDRSLSDRLRRSWQSYVATAALLPVGALLALVVLPAKLMLFASMSFGLVQIGAALSQRPALATVSVGWRAIVSWIAYDRNDRRLPGTFSSPSGSYATRLIITGSAVVVASTVMATMFGEIVITAGTLAIDPFAVLIIALVAAHLTAMAIVGVPVVITMPVLAIADSYRGAELTAENWQSVNDLLRNSVDPIERKSICQGRVAHDGSPLIIPKPIFKEHAHFLGDSGGGKTSLGLAPLMESLGVTGDCSLVLIDLKADSMELLGTLLATAEQAQREFNVQIPVKHFSNQRRRSTFAFNPLNNPKWHDLDLYTRTDILCGALGLEYGADYGEGFYSSANAAVLYAAIRHYPETRSFRELAEHVAYVSANAKRMGLHPEIAKAGAHVHTVLDRLGSFDSLNVTEQSPVSDEVRQQAIDFRSVFERPQFLYFHLSATLAPGSAPEMARLAAYDLLAAATQTTRHHQVYLVIDEFQRMIARNLEYMLQLARSMGVGVIIANQSMQDLKKSSMDLITPIESNCRYRQWFSVSSAEDRERLIKSSGETVDLLVSRSQSKNSKGGSSSSVSYQEHVTTRLTTTDILLASDHPKQSIVRISRGDGYAQYGGMPFILESNYHISQQEYERRQKTPWPDTTPGSFVPIRHTPPATPPRPTPPDRGPVIITVDSDAGLPRRSRPPADRRKSRRPKGGN